MEREAAEGSHSVADVALRSGGGRVKRDGGRQSLDHGPLRAEPAGPRGHKLQPN